MDTEDVGPGGTARQVPTPAANGRSASQETGRHASAQVSAASSDPPPSARLPAVCDITMIMGVGRAGWRHDRPHDARRSSPDGRPVADSSAVERPPPRRRAQALPSTSGRRRPRRRSTATRGRRARCATGVDRPARRRPLFRHDEMAGGTTGAAISRSRSGRAASSSQSSAWRTSAGFGDPPAAARSRSTSSTAHASTYSSSCSSSSDDLATTSSPSLSSSSRARWRDDPVPLAAARRAELPGAARPLPLRQRSPAPPAAAQFRHDDIQHHAPSR